MTFPLSDYENLSIKGQGDERISQHNLTESQNNTSFLSLSYFLNLSRILSTFF